MGVIAGLRSSKTASLSMLRDKRVMVTGGAGFVGRVVCDRLRAIGAREVIVPRRREHDLTDASVVRALLDSCRPEIVIHLAAESGGIGANLANPGRFFYANAMMALNLVEGSRIAGVEKFVGVGTVCSYPKAAPVPFRESDLWEGYPEETNAPYGIAKKAVLVMLDAYRQQYGFRGIYLMPTNIYGPGDNFDAASSHVIPALIRKCEAARLADERSITCWGTGSASREFVYVDDCASAILSAAAMYDSSDPVNIGGTRSEITIRSLAEMIASVCGFDGEIRWDPSRPDGQPRRAIDATRAREAFGFEPQTSFEVGIAQTLAWYREHGQDRPPRVH